MRTDERPLVLHVMHRFDTGGLENGIVNLINHMPPYLYRHAVLALTEVTEFKQRIRRNDVDFISLHKPPGQGFWQFPRLYRLFCQLRPQIVHSRNLAALEVQAPAWAAGVPVRIHGEHGRDLNDKDGKSLAYQHARRLYKPLVHHYTALSRDLRNYLVEKVNVPLWQITQVYNGVDVTHFHPAWGGALPIPGCPFDPAQHWLVGTVGRMQTIKDPLMLAQAFVQALRLAPSLQRKMRLVMVGDGPLREQAQAMLCAAGMEHLAWMPGVRTDVAGILRGLHAFALPSLSEGISNSILEAMATGLPIIATGVGGNVELVVPGKTGHIVSSADPQGMAIRLVQLACDPSHARRMGLAGRERVSALFSMPAMVSAYQSVYDKQLQRVGAMQIQR